MWTPTTRRQHSRAGLRYETDLTDAEWRLVAPLLPAPKRTGAPSQVSSNLPRLSSRRNSVGVLPVHRLNARIKVLGSR
jgi:hypothetical protein